jgi:hypothetical protein
MNLSDGPPIIGFFTTRIVRAKSLDEAEEKAKAMVLTDWTSGEYASSNVGSRPILRVDSVYGSNWWQHLRFKNKGHSFFAEEENAEQSVQPDRREDAAPG